jgi:hypothetical protein
MLRLNCLCIVVPALSKSTFKSGLLIAAIGSIAVGLLAPERMAHAQVSPSTEPVAGPPEVAPPPAPPPAAPGGLKIEGKDATVKFGFLAQPAYEYLNRTANTDEQFSTLFLRRARLMLLMTLGSQFELFFDTETANLGRGNGATPPGGGVFDKTVMTTQDIIVTWKPMDEFKLDVGMLLIPLSHNGLQGATTLYGWDYYAFSFQQNGGLMNYIGRDTGLQARGLIAKHFEYRLGLFTGRRAPAPAAATPPLPRQSQAAPRVAARVQYNVFDAESAFFYGGTYAGSKRILSVGAGLDMQKQYKAFAGDAFLDWPLGPDVVTAQLDFVHYDGGTAPDDWAPIAKQNDLMVEAGYRIGAIQISPIVRFEMAKMDTATAGNPNQTRIGAGVAWWYMGHNANLKLFYTYVKPEADGVTTLSAYNQINLQSQFYVF